MLSRYRKHLAGLLSWQVMSTSVGHNVVTSKAVFHGQKVRGRNGTIQQPNDPVWRGARVAPASSAPAKQCRHVIEAFLKKKLQTTVVRYINSSKPPPYLHLCTGSLKVSPVAVDASR